MGWGALGGAQTHCSLGRNSAIVIILLFARCSGVCVLTILQLHSSYPSPYGSFFISLLVEDLFCYIPVSLINSCSVNCCNFGVPVRGSEGSSYSTIFAKFPRKKTLLNCKYGFRGPYVKVHHYYMRQCVLPPPEDIFITSHLLQAS